MDNQLNLVSLLTLNPSFWTHVLNLFPSWDLLEREDMSYFRLSQCFSPVRLYALVHTGIVRLSGHWQLFRAVTLLWRNRDINSLGWHRKFITQNWAWLQSLPFSCYSVWHIPESRGIFFDIFHFLVSIIIHSAQLTLSAPRALWGTRGKITEYLGTYIHLLETNLL